MKALKTEDLQILLSQRLWANVVAILTQLDPPVAGDIFLSLPFEEQRVLFRRLPKDFAAKLVPVFPYYDAFVLLHTLPTEQMRLVMEGMNPIERLNFLDELPENAWQRWPGPLGLKAQAAFHENRVRSA